MKNLIGYKIEQDTKANVLETSMNYRPLFTILHLYMIVLYHFTQNSFFFHSFYGQSHYYYYLYLILYMVTVRYFTQTCNSPGFAVDEEDCEHPDENNLDPNRFYCKHCKIYVPLRSSHCSHCKKCVIRRDHHCPWTNCCVGRDNHVYFFIYTFLETFSQSIAFFEVLFHFISFFYFGQKLNKSMILIYVQVILASGFGTLKTPKMFWQCLSGILNNKTIWERVRGSRITYLKDYPFGYSPFDKGVVGNIVEFFTMKEKKMKWTIKPPDISLFSNELQKITENKGELYD